MGKGSGNVNIENTEDELLQWAPGGALQNYGGPPITCLMATYGRHTMVERAIACFLLQEYHNKDLFILNTHPIPLRLSTDPADYRRRFDDMRANIRVQIFNEPCWSTLGDQRNRLLALEAELRKNPVIRTWDDDDIYLPGSISQGVQGLLSNPSHAAWKPRFSYYSPDNGATFTLAENIHEPSITFRADVARKYGYFSNSSGDEHISLIDGVNHHEGGFAQGDVNDAGDGATFVYIWGNGVEHISGSLNQKVSAIERAAKWREKQRDVRLTPLKPDWTAAEEWFKKIEKWKSEHKT